MKNFSEISLIPFSNSYRPGVVESLRSLFYFLGPTESSFENISKVPNYTDAAPICFVSLILLELVIGLWKGRRTLRINDGVTSLSAGVISRIAKLVSTRSVELTLYIHVYDHWRLADLPWNSNWTWIVAFVGMDFLYYWFHRAAHEINLFWASHQTHHSSEDYNLSTALRQSSVQTFCSMWFYLGNALLVPPSVHLVHSQLNILYQFWIHTELIDNLGTFVAEKKDEKIAYGLVHNINTFNPIYIQLASYKDLFVRVWQIDGLWNKICVIVKGPGWSPGKPRLGNPTELPEVENPIHCYNPQIAYWLLAYGLVHYFSLVPLYDNMLALKHSIPNQMIAFDLIFFLGSLTCISSLYDKKSYAKSLEFCRCIACAVLMHVLKHDIEDIHKLPSNMGGFLEVLYIASAIFWFARMMFAFEKKKQI